MEKKLIAERGLERFAELSKTKEPPFFTTVNKVAIYFARFGYFAAIDIDDRIVGGDKFLSKFLGVIQDLKVNK